MSDIEQNSTPASEVETKPPDSMSFALTDGHLEQIGKWIGKEFKGLSRLRKKAGKLVEQSEEAFNELARRNEHLQTVQSGIESLKNSASEACGSCRSSAEEATKELLKATSARTNAEEASAAIVAHRESVEGVVAIAKSAAEKCAHIDDGHKYVLKVKPVFEQVAKDAESAAKQFAAATDEINARREQAKESAQAAETLRQSAQSDRATVERLVVELKTAHEDMVSSKAKLAEMISQSNELERRIESLLPGATSTGLAQAFEVRQKTHETPQMIWDVVSVASIVALVGFGWLFLNNQTSLLSAETVNWTRPLFFLAIRIPVAFGLIWLAIHAGRRAAELRRVREDYSYKAALAISFEGYKRQMDEIGADLPEDHPLRKLCLDTLTALSQPPGRLYDVKYQDSTPLSAMGDAIGSIMGGRKVRARAGLAEVEVDAKEGAAKAEKE